MIYVDGLRCTGCGDCLEVCPEGAISMQEVGVAFIDEALCQHCEVCVEACPEGAILTVDLVETPGRELEPARPQVPVRSVDREADLARPSLRQVAAPAVGAALLWTGRELLPRVGRLLLELLDRRRAAESPPLSLDRGSQGPLASANGRPARLNAGRGGRGGRGRRGRQARRRSRGGKGF